ncbi:hypothetical protein EB118_08790 [bacterium]|nr:hypothetical protein [bacterium]NDC94663.1 hypothetical protein [bacterium]NDD84306.1 hypothetical protein [bacterium]NDG30159.1 hypothetical protein [bacterium]
MNVLKIIQLSAWLTLLIVMVMTLLIRVEMHLDSKRNIQMDELLRTCKTGDLILFKWYYMDAGFRMFSKFSHVGMVVSDSQRTRILEMHPDGEYMDYPSGVYFHRLADRVKDYSGPCYFLRLKEDNARVQSFITENKSLLRGFEFDKNFRNNFVLNFFLAAMSVSTLTSPKKMFCSQFIGYILYHSGYIQTPYELLSPGSFEYLEEDGVRLFARPMNIVW